MSIRLVVGLGNHGTKYAATRHNAGRWLVKKFAADNNLTFKAETKFRSLIASSIDDNYWLLLPTTYMNLSGEALLKFAHFYKILPEEMLIIHDELDFLPGIIRFKKDGGHGGHNGLRSIVETLGSKDFYRLRIGIGHPGNKDLVSKYVLNEPSTSDIKLIEQAIDRGLAALPQIMAKNFELANRLLAED
jgi:PTH1 family peptidyl-tRNA hydrolase